MVRTRSRIQLASDMDPEIPDRASLTVRPEDSCVMFVDCEVWLASGGGRNLIGRTRSIREKKNQRSHIPSFIPRNS